MAKRCTSGRSVETQEEMVDLVQRNKTRERRRRTVASESLLPKASVNQVTRGRKRGGQRQDDKGIPVALVYKHCRWIVPIYSSKRSRQTDMTRSYRVASYLPAHACHGLASGIPSWIGVLEARGNYCTIFFCLSLGTSLSILFCKMPLKNNWRRH